MGAVLARAQFTSELGREWEVEIYDLDETGTPTILDFEVAAPGFTIQYESPNDDLLEPIKASKCSTEMIIQPGDTGLEALITDIAQADDGRYFIIISEATSVYQAYRAYRDHVLSSGGTMFGDIDVTFAAIKALLPNSTYTPYWWGPILTDMVKEPNTYPTLINLVATDALGRLKEIDYVDGSGDPPTGRKRFTEIIAEILELSGNGTQIVNKDYMKFSTEWYNSTHATTSLEPMEYTAVRVENYWTRDDETGNVAAPSCYDVLKSILHDWNARIILSAGYYHIEQATTYEDLFRDETIIDDTGDNVSSTSRAPYLTIDQTDNIELAGGKREWAKPVIEVKRIYEHRYSANILTQQPDYFGSANNVLFPYVAVPLEFATAGVNKKFIIDGEVELVITNNTGSDYANANSLIELALAVVISNGTTTYYLRKDVWDDEGAATWSTTVGGRYYATVPMGKLLDGEQFRKVFRFSITTPSFTEDDMTGTTFYINYGVSPEIYANFGATAGIGVSINEIDFDLNPYAGTYNGDTVLQGRTNFMFMGMQGGNNESDVEIQFTATNTSGTTVNTYDYPQNALIGSRFKSNFEPGLLRVTADKSTYSVDTGTWDYESVSGTDKFNDLSVLEAMRMKKNPRERKYATIFAYMNAVDAIAYGLDHYAFCGGKFIANNDRWQGVWEFIGRQTAAITSGSASLPNPAGITGGTTQPTLPNTGGVVAGLAGAVSQGSVNQTIAKGSTITGITIGAFFKSGVIASGDDITVISSSTGQSQVFTTTAKVDSGDTSISVSSATTDFDIGPGDLIVLSAQQQSTNIPTIVTTSISSLLVASGSVSGSGFYYQQNYNGLVFVNIQFSVSGVSSPTGSVQFQSLNWPIPQAGYRFSYYVDTLATLSDGIKPMISQSSGNLRLFDETLTGLDGSEIQTGTKIFATIVYPDSI